MHAETAIATLRPQAHYAPTTRHRPAHTMLYMAEAGLHSFDYDSGRWVNAELERTGLDEDAKHTVIVKLHHHIEDR